MNSYCLSCKKNTENTNQKMAETKNNKLIILSKCAICNNKKSRFISQGSGLLDSLGLNAPQNRIKKCFLECF